MTTLALGIMFVWALANPTGAFQAAAAARGPETFKVTATVLPRDGNASGAITVPITIQIDAYNPPSARTKMLDGLKYGGYPGFLLALRQTPAAGTLLVAGERFAIRWAREEPAEAGRRITLVTDAPIHFVGGARKGAKSTSGYEVAVVLLNVNAAGSGDGTMAAAARVKPKDVTGVQVDDYAETPIKLTVAGGK